MSAQDALRTHLITEPDDAESWQVWADQLEIQGDARARLIRLQHTGQDEAARAHLFAHRAQFLGPMADRVQQHTVEWRLGYMRRLDMVIEHHCRGAVALFHHLQQTHAGWMLEHVRLITSTLFNPALKALIALRPPRLRSIDVGPTSMGAGRVTMPIQDLLDAFPHLQSLRVQFPSDIQRLRHPTLRTLRVAGQPSTFERVDLSGLPQLDCLELHSRYDVMTPDQLISLRQAPIRRVELHAETTPWLLAHGPAPAEIVLHGRAADALPEAQALGAKVRIASEVDPSMESVLTPESQTRARQFIKGDRFWRIRRDGAQLVLRYGKRGKRGRTMQRPYRTAYGASRDYVERHAKKLADGHTEVFVPEAEWLD